MHGNSVIPRRVAGKWLLLVSFGIVAMLLDVPCQGSPPSEGQVDLHAVVVGVSKYLDPSIPTLNLSAKDAKDFADFIRERKSLYRNARIKLLLNEEATRDNVTRALREDLAMAKEGDIVIIYFSAHGSPNPDPSMANEFYLITHDARPGNLYATGVRMNDPNLLAGIKAKGVLMVADTCYSWGFFKELDARPKSMGGYLGTFAKLDGRFAIASSDSSELSYEQPDKYKNSIFTHFFLKGLRGEAAVNPGDGKITVKELYNYVAKSTSEATARKQNPKVFPAGGAGDDTVIFLTPKYSDPLRVDVQFQSVDFKGQLAELTDDSELRSGDAVGVIFRPHADCYVYIYWWDSSGQVGRLFPNPELTDGEVKAKAGQTYWLPRKGNEGARHRWFELDDTPGTETIYFVASRERNRKLEDLYSSLQQIPEKQRTNAIGKDIAGNMEREIRLMSMQPMGMKNKTVIREVQVAKGGNRGALFEAMKNEVDSAGAEKAFAVTFKHLPK